MTQLKSSSIIAQVDLGLFGFSVNAGGFVLFVQQPTIDWIARHHVEVAHHNASRVLVFGFLVDVIIQSFEQRLELGHSSFVICSTRLQVDISQIEKAFFLLGGLLRLLQHQDQSSGSRFLSKDLKFFFP